MKNTVNPCKSLFSSYCSRIQSWIQPRFLISQSYQEPNLAYGNQIQIDTVFFVQTDTVYILSALKTMLETLCCEDPIISISLLFSRSQTYPFLLVLLHSINWTQNPNWPVALSSDQNITRKLHCEHSVTINNWHYHVKVLWNPPFWSIILFDPMSPLKPDL